MKLVDFKGVSRPGLLSWLAVSLLGVACCALAILQYRWITDFSGAQRVRLREELQGRLNLFARSFDDEIASASAALVPPSNLIDQMGAQRAYASHFASHLEGWKQSHQPVFQRISLAIPEHGEIALWDLDFETSEFQRAEWPSDWASERTRLLARINGSRVDPSNRQSAGLIELPHFSPDRDQPRRADHREDHWLLAELNQEYLRTTLFPDLLKRYVGDGGKLNYDAEIVSTADPAGVIYQSTADHVRIANDADASVGLLDTAGRVAAFREDSFRGPLRRGGPPGFPGRRPFGPPGPPHGGPAQEGRPGPGPLEPVQMPAPGLWRLSVRHHAGSLETLVDQARRRNIVVSGGLLLLILATMAALVRVSRQSQRLAQAQMNFVAGVSHELRTPLTVIRTAAFNLRGKLAARPEQVEEYGKLIQRESEKLTGLVEQVLRFASGEAGHIIREREPMTIESLIDLSIESGRESLETRGVEVEMHIQPGLPLVLADRQAMQHALRNMIENAVKYGAERDPWVGVYAERIVVPDKSLVKPFVEIRVADHGPGIPEDELDHIFDPFFRGRRAVTDQLHGTGLGLSLVKKIIEAHGGSISVHSEPDRRTEFIVRIPTAPPELQHEFAHSLS
ncbi:MAG TPA: HAMP domain-containing sensor histidine kinase [Bryobacteraceae bacterium]|nr:HAMP domain-containing sensor histidine kinase [Bryobacteraceae bacterium]